MMDFVVVLVVFPLIITVLTVVVVFYLGFTGVIASSVVISLYYTFGLNGVRLFSPNGNNNVILPMVNLTNFAISFLLSFAGLFLLHYVFEYFKN